MSLLKKFKSKGVEIKKINWIFIVLVCCFCFFVFWNTISVNHEYGKIISEMNDYTECDKAINDFRDAEQYLTNQMRLFAMNFDIDSLNNYYEEYNVVRRRQSALEILEFTHIGDEPDVCLKMALRESEYLREIEIYSQKLIVEGLGNPPEIPQDKFSYVTLTEEDKALSNQQKIQKGREMLYDSVYLSSKERTLKNSSTALNSLINSSINNQYVQNSIIAKQFIHTTISIGVLVFICVVFYFLILFAILRPISKHIKSIEKGEKMKNIGSCEVRYIARTYNSLIEKNEIKASVLRHKAEHDFLTGLINRAALDQIKNVFRGSQEAIAYLLIDIDLFKNINDTYGHGVGDEVLKKIGHLLLDQFRNTDYVARIGGDEFAVIMTKFGDSPVSVIHKKIASINNILQNIQDGLPSVSLSVGVAFSDCGYDDVLETQADEALYKVKKGGRCNCSFYKDNSNNI